MLKYLVTGGCGFIGSHIVDRLVEEGHHVRVLDNFANSSPQYLPAQAELVVGSITDDAILKQAIQGIDGIFHLAALVSVTDSIEHWHQNHLVNCSATIRLLELAQGVPVILASSAAVYGDTPELPQREVTLPRPLSPYALDKLTCERHAKLAWDLHRSPTASFRFFNVYGPRQNPFSPYSGVISKFASLLEREAPLTIYGDGEQQRDFIFVKDVAEMLVKTMSSPLKGAGVYNLCSGHSISINALADLMGKITGSAVRKEYAPPRSGEILVSCGDPTKALQVLGLQARTSLIEGLSQLMRSALLH